MTLSIHKNSEGVFRVKIGSRWMLDEDLMIAVTGNHRSQVLNFFTRVEAEAAATKYNEKINRLTNLKAPETEPLVVKDDFKEDN